MSEVAHPGTPFSAQPRGHRLVVLLGALLALLATATVVLVLAIDGGPSSLPITDQAQPAARGDGGPEESGVAAAVAPRPPAVMTDESRIAAAIGAGRETSPAPPRPDESSVAAAISGG